MPVYEYTCQDCQSLTEAIRPMADADASIDCQHCGGGNTRRAHSVFTAASGSGPAPALPPGGGCGRCGDPNGACGL